MPMVLPQTPRSVSLVVACALLLAASGLSAAPADASGASSAVRVTDIDTLVTGGTSGDDSTLPWANASVEFVEFAGAVYFTADDGVHGSELWRTDGSAAGTELVADLCPGVCSSFPHHLTVVGSTLFFRADDGLHGGELWKSDGTGVGTALVADLRPGLDGSEPYELVALGGAVLFSANDGVSGSALWRSDGTAAGTTKLLVPNPTGASFQFAPGGVIGDVLVFSASDGVHGSELWRSDGTPEGTAMIADLDPGAPGSTDFLVENFAGSRNYAVVGDRLFFSADDGVHGLRLWTTDGTTPGTGQVANSPDQPSHFAALGDALLFMGCDDTAGCELWRSDGTGAGTGLLKDIAPDPYLDSRPTELIRVGDRVFFHASDGIHGEELWSTDGTEAGTVMARDIRPGTDSALYLVAAIADVGGTAVFFADDGVHGIEPWRSDGSEAGTQLLADLDPGPESSYDPTFPQVVDRRVVFGGRWYFRARTAPSRRYPGNYEVWTSDGTTAGTAELKEIDDQASSFAVAGWNSLLGLLGPLDAHTLLMRADDGVSGPELWRTDGTAETTSQVADLYPGPEGASPHILGAVPGGALVSGASATDCVQEGSAVWRTDGTAAGTAVLHPDTPLCGVNWEGTSYDGDVLFEDGSSLWRSDGTDAGTAILGGAGKGSYGPGEFVHLGDLVIYNDHGQLFRTDGTPAGTFEVKDINPGGDWPQPTNLVVAGGRVFFVAGDDAAGRELWSTDGTEGGTARVADLRPGPASAITERWDFSHSRTRRNVGAAGTHVLFAADDGGGAGEELWAVDAADGAQVPTLLADLLPGAGSSQPDGFVTVGDRAYFTADDGVHGRELWRSDGTAAGTEMVADLRSGAASSSPQELTAFGGVLVFAADDGVHGLEPWQTDGTPAGTHLIQDLAPGPLPSSPRAFTALGPFVYFVATDATTGFELWRLRLSPFQLFADGFESGDLSGWSTASP
jgi:ELWxxDGT repeat protein